MRRIYIFTVICCMAFPLSIFAEAVFIKDGNIIEGKIVSENKSQIEVRLEDKTRKKIPRTDILRILYHENFKDKRYLTKMDGTVIEVYIVDEEAKSYLYRTELFSPDEKRILKDDVDSISKRKVPTNDKDSVIKTKPRAIPGTKLFDNGDGTITDTRTGVIWMKDANISGKGMGNQAAIEYCKKLDAYGYNDWRLPTKKEFSSFIKEMPEDEDLRPLFLGMGIFNIQKWYWTNDRTGDSGWAGQYGWNIDMTTGSLNQNKLEAESGYVWPVRGGKKK